MTAINANEPPVSFQVTAEEMKNEVPSSPDDMYFKALRIHAIDNPYTTEVTQDYYIETEAETIHDLDTDLTAQNINRLARDVQIHTQAVARSAMRKRLNTMLTPLLPVEVMRTAYINDMLDEAIPVFNGMTYC